jgi:hypothetical protein
VRAQAVGSMTDLETKVYQGHRYGTTNKVQVKRQNENGAQFSSALGRGTMHWSGFKDWAWGDHSDGSRQLAISILSDAVDREYALELYPDFLLEIVTRLPQGHSWEMPGETVREWVALHPRLPG